MSESEPFVTYLELRESTAEGEAGAGLSHTGSGLVLLHVLELAAHGEPRGAVTVVHDAGEHGPRYLPLAHELSAAGWAVALPDLRGHGRSEGERGHSAGIREVVRDLSDVQDHLAYRQPTASKVLVGQGLGALYALAYACERPEGLAALVLSAPLLEPRFDVPRSSGGLLRRFRRSGSVAPLRIAWTPEQLTSDPVERRKRDEDALVHAQITQRAAEQAAAAAREYRPKISSLSMPTLVLQGRGDPIVRASDVLALAGRNVDVRVFEGMLHDLFHDTRTAEVVDVLKAWLDEKLAR